MEAKYSAYDVTASDARIKDILDSTESFEEVNTIPARNSLTYSNGFYVNCTAVFIDIRGSSKLTDSHTRPVIGKIYRAYISECVSIMNADENCSEVFITGDCVSGIFNTPYQYQIVSAFEVAGQLSSLIELLNWHLKNKGYQPIVCGIGIAYGRALMIQTGAKGSGVNDVVWIGDVVNEAAHLCHEGNKGDRKPVQVSTTVFNNLTEKYKGFCNGVGIKNFFESENYETDIFNIPMREYFDKEKEKAALNFWASIFANTTYPTGGVGLGLLGSGLKNPPK
ncbi:MAG: adenylate/guanylate cyclase domain-containing protein [Gallionellaceae bacterium]|nr:adenylate/guanylate cyclase domain-containing protein [Gallionellaceae bacterium]